MNKARQEVEGLVWNAKNGVAIYGEQFEKAWKDA